MSGSMPKTYTFRKESPHQIAQEGLAGEHGGAGADHERFGINERFVDGQGRWR
jgi:hypothetical protein